MRRTFAGSIAALAVVGLSFVLVGPVSASTTRHVSGQITGAEISSTQSVFKIHSSTGMNGAGVSTIHGTSGIGKVYFGNGTETDKTTLKVGTANSAGVTTLTGTTKIISGTGAYKNVKGTSKLTGTINTKTLVYNLKFKGTVIQ